MSDTDNETYSEEREALIAVGIPSHVIDYAISHKPSHWFYTSMAWVFITVMVAGFIAGAFVWGALEDLVGQNALLGAKKLDALLYYHNFGIAPLIALFAWIFAAGVVAYWLASLSRKMRASMFVYTILDSNNAPYLKLGKSIESLQHESDPEAYIRQLFFGWLRIALWPAVILFALSGVVLEREFKTFSAYTIDGYVAYPLAPWDEVKSGSWSEAALVSLGCNHVTGRGASDDIIYRVKLQSGASHDVAGAYPVSGAWLDQVEKIDNTLRNSDAIFQRWQWLKRDPIHPKCLSAQGRRYNREELERIYHLLRIGEFTGDS